jgi:hypothetical protein
MAALTSVADDWKVKRQMKGGFHDEDPAPEEVS